MVRARLFRLADWLSRSSILTNVAKPKGQLSLPIQREPEPDRNFHLGGRSFYFFDLDDNVAFLDTPLFLFKKSDRTEIQISSQDFAQIAPSVGQLGQWRDFSVDFNPIRGTFREFRDQPLTWKDRLLRKQQSFIRDLQDATKKGGEDWQGPSWPYFYHAVLNQRPMSIITARGHSPATLRAGFQFLFQAGIIPRLPNILGLFPVSHPETRASLDDPNFTKSIAEVKKEAIKRSVYLAFAKYGYSSHHRFGMSDDDPQNIELITAAMAELKDQFPRISFFVIDSQKERVAKWEVFKGYCEKVAYCVSEQLSLFGEEPEGIPEKGYRHNNNIE